MSAFPGALSPLAFAYRQARAAVADGSGFRFLITLRCGKEIDCIPRETDPLTFAPKTSHDDVAFWIGRVGDDEVVIRHSEIAALQVYRV